MGLKKGDALTFSASGQTQTMQQGKISLDDGKRMPWLLFEVAVTFANASGSPITFTANQIAAWLAGWTLLLKHGLSTARNPFNNIDLQTLRQMTRTKLGIDWTGLLDTTNGFGAAVPATGSKAMTFYFMVPLGYDFKDDALKSLWGVGPAQAASIQLAMKRLDVLPANITITGNVILQMQFVQRSAKFEQFDPFEEYEEPADSKKLIDVSDGWTMVLAEKTNPSATSPLSSIAVRVDGDNEHYAESAAEIAAEFVEDPELPASANISDTYTVLAAYNTRYRMEEIPPGVAELEQLIFSMTNYTLAHLYRPLLPEASVYAEVSKMAVALKREVRVCSLATALGVQVPDWMKAFLPWAILTAAEGDALDTECLRATPSQPAALFIPATRLKRIKDALGSTKASNPTAHNSLLASVLANVPGSIPNPAALKWSPVPQPSMAFFALSRLVG